MSEIEKMTQKSQEAMQAAAELKPRGRITPRSSPSILILCRSGARKMESSRASSVG